MNLFKLFIISLILLATIKESASAEVLITRDSNHGPLALIKQRGSSLLQLAKPHKYLNQKAEAGYIYDDSEENNESKEEFLLACPADNDKKELLHIEANWKKNNNYEPSSSGRVLFLKETYIGIRFCRERAIPMIQKAEKRDKHSGLKLYCGRAEAEIYAVGYAVSNKDGTDIQFISIYEICHSTTLAQTKENQGTLYSIHSLDSPSLLLLQLEDGTEPNLEYSFQSFLDKDLEKVIPFYKGQHVYQFVAAFDMPTKVWENTTYFPFNYIPIPSSPELYKGMQEVDDYIRLFSRQRDTPLKLYSGTHETTKTIKPIACINMCANEVTVKLFWRIIMNMENEAIMVVTQHSPKSCNQTYICDKGLVAVKSYSNDGCIYTCPVNDDLTMLLGLPKLNIKGPLPFTIPVLKKLGDKKRFSKGTKDITHFVGRKRGFLSGLRKVDPALADTLAPTLIARGGRSHGGGNGGGGNGFFGFTTGTMIATGGGGGYGGGDAGGAGD